MDLCAHSKPRSHCLRRVDFDDLLAYSTTKRVQIRDARLGVVFYLLASAVVAYILIYQFLSQGGYLAFEVPSNAVRMTLQQPTRLDGQPCNPSHATCLDNFASPAALPYCWTPDRTVQEVSGASYKNHNCSYMDGSQVTALHGTSILMATAVRAYTQRINPECETSFGSAPSETCQKLWLQESDSTGYVVDPEQFTLLVDHTATAPGIEVDHQRSTGYLYVEDGGSHRDRFCRENAGVADLWSQTPASEAPCYVPPAKVGTADYFKVGFLLESLGISLDEVSPASKSTQPELRRYSGMIVRMVIEYQNFRPFRLGVQPHVRYVYKLTALPGSTYKESRTVHTNYPTTRVEQTLRGILFSMQVGGYLARFDFTAMLIQLTTSLALLAVATTVVDFLATYCFQYSPFYRHEMRTTSPDFSDLRAANKLTDEELEGELGLMGQHTGGDRIARVVRLLAAGWVPALQKMPESVADEEGDQVGEDEDAHLEESSSTANRGTISIPLREGSHGDDAPAADAFLEEDEPLQLEEKIYQGTDAILSDFRDYKGYTAAASLQGGEPFQLEEVVIHGADAFERDFRGDEGPKEEDASPAAVSSLLQEVLSTQAACVTEIACPRSGINATDGSDAAAGRLDDLEVEGAFKSGLGATLEVSVHEEAVHEEAESRESARQDEQSHDRAEPEGTSAMESELQGDGVKAMDEPSDGAVVLGHEGPLQDEDVNFAAGPLLEDEQSHETAERKGADDVQSEFHSDDLQAGDADAEGVDVVESEGEKQFEQDRVPSELAGGEAEEEELSEEVEVVSEAAELQQVVILADGG